MKENKKKSALDKFNIWAEKDKYPKRYISPTIGKPKPWYARLFKNIVYAVIGFTIEVIAAIKAIIKEVM